MSARGSYIFTMQGVSKTSPAGKPIVKDLNLSFFYQSKIGVIGANGSGKSTVLRMMAGLDKDFYGDAKPAANISVGYLAQEPELNPNATAWDVVQEGVQEDKALLQAYADVSEKLGTCSDDFDALLQKQSDLQEQIDANDAWEIDRRVDIAMRALGCPPNDTPVSQMSGGEKRRVALCRLLLQKPDLLMLDEPTNHLDANSVAWLEAFLKSYRGTLLLITHDRYFLDNIVEWILELDGGEAFPFKGNYSAWLIFKQKKLLDSGSKDVDKAMERELKWLSYANKSKNSTNQERIASYEQRIQSQLAAGTQILIPSGPRLGQTVLELDGLTKAYGDRTLISNLSLCLSPGAIVGIIGLNGVGKTTLFRLLTGQETPDSGTVRWGSTVKLGYVDQERARLNPLETVWEAISDKQEVVSLGTHTISSRAYCGSFQFKGTDQQKRVRDLSGGERNRVNLAKLLKEGANVLLIDEPTNDLDVGTIRALEEAIEAFAGCALIISHDRCFLDRLATHILAFEAPGQVCFFPGNYKAYQEAKLQQARSGAARHDFSAFR